MSADVLKPENLRFNRGNSNFKPEDFLKYVRPYFKDLQRVGRTNHLCVFIYGDGSKPDVTGYRTDTTINATINERALRSERTGGMWAVYDLVTE